ncbi:hypothetical protein [Roseomonas gilardii]|uniref:hypothetical protein n=1 Tax=Roseomonas gilardii TaxID=257708 RepID=UPI0012EC0C5F|nr:hypothetical protein [Roseomonas gilardii]
MSGDFEKNFRSLIVVVLRKKAEASPDPLKYLEEVKTEISSLLENIECEMLGTVDDISVRAIMAASVSNGIDLLIQEFSRTA